MIQVIVLSLLCAAPVPASDAKPKLVVLELGAAGGVPAEVASALTETIATEVDKRGFFAVISSRDVQVILGAERQRQMLGACGEGSTGCAAELGNALGARFAMSGTLAKLGSSYQLTLQVLDTLKAVPVGRSTKIANDLESLRLQIPYAVAEASGTPLPPPPSRVLSYSLVAGGAVAMIVGGLVGFDGLTREAVVKREFTTSLINPSVLKTYAQYREEKNAIANEKTISLVSMLAGAALIGSGIYLSPAAEVSASGIRVSLIPTGNGGALVGVFP